MKKHALIISNPGELYANNYCEGVKVDVFNYISFLKSPLGGYWYDSEITHLNRPSKYDVNKAIENMALCDYVFIVFSGHGYYCLRRESTILELRKNEEINSLDLREKSRKRTIVLDCCRKVEKEIITDALMESKLAKAATGLTPLKCRKYFEKKIEECSNGIVVVYACSKNETAGDSQSKGGYYSYSLLKIAKTWGEKIDIDLSVKWKYLNIVNAHNMSIQSVSRLSGDNQNPDIEKPRSDPYFPIAIMA